MLTERQLKLLDAIINEYIKTSEPVGSVEIVKKYNLKCSPATIRNEMAKLIDKGFLQMLHTSSGRVPTRTAYRLYLNELMIEDEIPVLKEVAMKQRLWGTRYEFEKLLRESAVSLSEHLQELVIITTTDGFLTNAGTYHVLDNKEFWDIDVAKSTLMLSDDYEMMQRIFSGNKDVTEVKFSLEEEIGMDDLNSCGIVYTDFTAGKRTGHIVVVGPSRLNYSEVIPAVKYTKQLIQELGGAW